MKKILLVLSVLLCALCLFANTSVKSRIIDSDSFIYDYMDILYSLNNKAKPQTARPWTESQARLLLDSINREEQSETAKQLYDEIEEVLDEGQRWNFEDFAFSVVPEINVELYVHTNTDSFTTESQFVRSYADRKPWLKVSFDFSVSDFFYTESDIQWRTARGSHKDVWAYRKDSLTQASDGNYYVASYKIAEDSTYPVTDFYFKRAIGTNVNFDTYDFSFIWPRKAIVSVGGDNWNVSINRDRMKIGDAHFGNLLVDDYSDYNDYINVSFFSKKFTYNWYLMPLNTSLSENEEEVNDESRLYMIHTLDFRIFDRVSLKISENVMYKYNVFDFSFMNPAFIYHNLNNRAMFNAIAYAEVNASVLPGLDIYAEYALDQARAPNEGDGQSDASGLVVGAEYTVEALGGVFENYAEFARTTPLLYRRDLLDFVKASSYYHQGSANKDDSGDNFSYGHYTEFEYIGFPFGGDAQVIMVGTNYTKPGFINAGFSVASVKLGAMTIEKSHNKDGNNLDSANISGKTPTTDSDGNYTKALVVSANAEIDLERYFKYPDTSAFVEIDLVNVATVNKETKERTDSATDCQITLGISCKF